MFITTRQFNAALSGLKLAADCRDTQEDKEFYKVHQKALEVAIEKCLKRKVSGLEVPNLVRAEFILKVAKIHDKEIRRRRK